MKISGNQLRLKGGQSSVANGIDGGRGGDPEDRTAIEAGQRIKTLVSTLRPGLAPPTQLPYCPQLQFLKAKINHTASGSN